MRLLALQSNPPACLGDVRRLVLFKPRTDQHLAKAAAACGAAKRCPPPKDACQPAERAWLRAIAEAAGKDRQAGRQGCVLGPLLGQRMPFSVQNNHNQPCCNSEKLEGRADQLGAQRTQPSGAADVVRVRQARPATRACPGRSVSLRKGLNGLLWQQRPDQRLPVLRQRQAQRCLHHELHPVCPAEVASTQVRVQVARGVAQRMACRAEARVGWGGGGLGWDGCDLARRRQRRSLPGSTAHGSGSGEQPGAA